MKLFKIFLLLLFVFGSLAFNYGQSQTKVRVTKLTEKLYKITFNADFGVNTMAFIGKDGLLLVDTGFKATAEKFVEELKKLGNAKPIYIISTHEHIDHVGGNFIFGKDPIIIGHKKLKSRMKADCRILQEYPGHAFPDITLTDSHSINFNGEEIRIISIAGGHTDNDIMVHFTKSGYAYLGDDAYGMRLPSYDGRSGDCSKYAAVVKKALDLLPDNTKIISGHGRDMNMGQMRVWQKTLEDSTEIIRKEIEKGTNVKTMIKRKILRQRMRNYKESATEDWIYQVYYGFKGIKYTVKSAKAEYYRAYKKGGIKAVTKIHAKMVKQKKKEYNASPYMLDKFAAYLLDKNKISDCIKLLKFCIKVYRNAYFFYNRLGSAYFKKGDIKKAVSFYKKSIKIQPRHNDAVKMLEHIKKNNKK